MSVMRDDSDRLSRLFIQSDMAAAAASELLSPLILIRQLGLTMVGDEMSDKERKLLGERLTLTSERAIRLASSLSMTSLDQSILRLEPINPISVCREVIHELRPLFTAYDKKIELQTRARTPLLVGDRKLLQDILLGLGDNALYFGSKAQPVRMSVVSKNDFVRIAVRDFGPTVPSNLWERLENGVAKHIAAPIAGRTSASGVTLLVARQLAALMGAHIGLVRHQDGATFFIDLHISRQMSLV